MSTMKKSSLLNLLILSSTLVNTSPTSKRFGSKENLQQISQLTSAEVKERIKLMDIVAVKNNNNVAAK